MVKTLNNNRKKKGQKIIEYQYMKPQNNYQDF